MATRERVLSGMRPSGRLHLGNYLGALANWVKLQDDYDCFYFSADWHVLTDRADPGHVLLVEIYRDDAAAAAHKATAHYLRWREAVADMMARPRQATRYVNTSPDDADW